MTLLYIPVKIPFQDIITKHTIEQTKQHNSDSLYTERIEIPNDELLEINNYLASVGISKLMVALSFKRNTTYIRYQSSHLDYSQAIGVINCSIVIPIEGCKNTGQIWYTGDYNIKIAKMDNGINYALPDWINPGFELDRVEIYDSPMLVRTNVPHSAFSNGHEYRVTCTLRFENNESFEYLAERLSK